MTGRFQPPVTVMDAAGAAGRRSASTRSIRAASASDDTRTSSAAVAAPARTFGRVPPRTTPTLSDVPASRSAAPCRARTTRASSSTALAPPAGSRPACTSTPWMCTSKSPTPFRAVLSAPSGPADASNTSTGPGVRRTTSSMIGREPMLPTSSSPFRTSRMFGRGRSRSSRRATAWANCTRPAFMSYAPGPARHAPSIRTGQSASVPAGQTVS
ncbi:hypothetical protein P9139_13105 [Curtobacterium flaccumfaciens]|nr:hypothetical protein P9139_13105 [Curtobacterium flaccumfaciens]